MTGGQGPIPHKLPTRTAARSRVAAGYKLSELALDGDEDRVTSTLAGGSHVAGGPLGPAPVVPVNSVPSDAGGDIAAAARPDADSRLLPPPPRRAAGADEVASVKR